MAKGIKASIIGMVMAIEIKEFEKEDKSIVKYVKLQVHDKESKQTLDIKYDGEVEEFLQLGIEEYNSYDMTLEFNSYKTGVRSNISCKITSINKI